MDRKQLSSPNRNGKGAADPFGRPFLRLPVDVYKASLDGRQVTCQFAAVHDDAAAPDNGALVRG